MNKRFLWLLPSVFLLLMSCIGFLIATPGRWHSEMTEFWQNQKWHEIKALAGNLDRTNRSDSETLYIAARAASILQDSAATAHFSSRFLQKRALTWDAELWLEQNYEPHQILERVRLYRTRGITCILVIVTILNFLLLWKDWNSLPWSAIISSAGIVLTLI